MWGWPEGRRVRAGWRQAKGWGEMGTSVIVSTIKIKFTKVRILKYFKTLTYEKGNVPGLLQEMTK